MTKNMSPYSGAGLVTICEWIYSPKASVNGRTDDLTVSRASRPLPYELLGVVACRFGVNEYKKYLRFPGMQGAEVIIGIEP
jgi:hypothetical protein